MPDKSSVCSRSNYSSHFAVQGFSNSYLIPERDIINHKLQCIGTTVAGHEALSVGGGGQPSLALRFWSGKRPFRIGSETSLNFMRGINQLNSAELAQTDTYPYFKWRSSLHIGLDGSKLCKARKKITGNLLK